MYPKQRIVYQNSVLVGRNLGSLCVKTLCLMQRRLPETNRWRRFIYQPASLSPSSLVKGCPTGWNFLRRSRAGCEPGGWTSPCRRPNRGREARTESRRYTTALPSGDSQQQWEETSGLTWSPADAPTYRSTNFKAYIIQNQPLRKEIERPPNLPMELRKKLDKSFPEFDNNPEN